MRQVAALLFLAIIVSPVHAAESCDEATTCTGTTKQLNECMAHLLAKQDARLNKTYRQLVARIKRSGDPEARSLARKLRRSQKSWITYRDRYCDFRRATAGHGTIRTLLYLDCQCTLTKDKADHLTDDLQP